MFIKKLLRIFVNAVKKKIKKCTSCNNSSDYLETISVIIIKIVILLSLQYFNELYFIIYRNK